MSRIATVSLLLHRAATGSVRLIMVRGQTHAARRERNVADPTKDEFEEALEQWQGEAYLAAIGEQGGQQAISAFVEAKQAVRAAHSSALAEKEAETWAEAAYLVDANFRRFVPSEVNIISAKADELRRIFEQRAAEAKARIR